MLEAVTPPPLKEVVDKSVIEPEAGVSHFKPVASALSATNLIQEQSQRIVLGA